MTANYALPGGSIKVDPTVFDASVSPDGVSKGFAGFECRRLRGGDGEGFTRSHNRELVPARHTGTPSSPMGDLSASISRPPKVRPA